MGASLLLGSLLSILQGKWAQLEVNSHLASSKEGVSPMDEAAIRNCLRWNIKFRFQKEIIAEKRVTTVFNFYWRE